ncbi:RND family transporter [Treponema berlinense]|uniref:efflux RND transporter permease subunit n=1 Tax=Treponema berlinense TaxID=225004 RepID=UPI0026ED8317|nr:efflux RND transporter permease subunit [Treponema berlinense]
MNRFFKHPWLIIVTTFIVTGLLAFQLKDIQMDDSTRLYFPQKHESYQRLIESEDRFGSTVVIGVSLETDKGTVVTPEILSIIDRISTDVEKLPTVDRVDSLTNIDFIEDVDGALTAGNIIDLERDEDGYLPLMTVEQTNILKQNLRDWDEMYTRSIISDDNKAAQMQITLITNNHPGEFAFASLLSADEIETLAKGGIKTFADFKKLEKKGGLAAVEGLDEALLEKVRTVIANEKSESDIERETLESVKEITEKYTKGTGLKVIYFGDPVVSANMREFIISDLTRLIPIVSIVVLLTLFASLKTLDGTVLPLITVLFSTACTCGLMAIFKFTFTIVTSVIPVALIACGSAYGIHVLTHYYIALDEELKKGTVITKENHKEIVLKGVGDCKVAVFLAAVTTVIGFISLVSSPMGPLHSFAIFTAVGVALSFLLSVTFIPAVLMVKSEKQIGKKSRLMQKVTRKVKKHTINRGNASHDTLYNIFIFFCGTKPRMYVFGAALIILSFFGIKKLAVDTSIINYFPEDSRLRQDIDYVDQRFAGTNMIFMLVDGPAVKDEAGNVLDENGIPVMNSEGKFLDVNGNIIKKSDGRKAALVEGSMKNPDVLEALDGLQENLYNKFPFVGKVISFPTLIKRMNQVLHAPSADSLAVAGSASEDFGDFEGFDDFGFDDFGDFGGFDSSGDFDGFGGVETGDSSEEFEMLPDYVDPNVAYVEKLNSTITVEEGMALLTSAYAEAGGANASLDSVVKLLEKKLNYKGKDFYEIPYDEAKYGYAQHSALQNIVGNFLSMLSDKDTLGRWANDPQNENVLNPNRLRIQMILRSQSTDAIESVVNECNSYVANHFPEGYTVSFTGKGELESVMTDMVVSSQLQSLIFSLFCVFVVLTLSFKSGWAGLLGALPLAFTILLNYMTMGFTEIKLDLVTSIIASVAVGIGIDYTIHFLETYRMERALTSDVHEAARKTFASSGVGILTNALAVGLGFLVLCLSKFAVLRYIGILVAIVMFTSSMLSMTILPGFLTNYDPKFSRPKVEPVENAGNPENKD